VCVSVRAVASDGLEAKATSLALEGRPVNAVQIHESRRQRHRFRQRQLRGNGVVEPDLKLLDRISVDRLFIKTDICVNSRHL